MTHNTHTWYPDRTHHTTATHTHTPARREEHTRLRRLVEEGGLRVGVEVEELRALVAETATSMRAFSSWSYRTSSSCSPTASCSSMAPDSAAAAPPPLPACVVEEKDDEDEEVEEDDWSTSDVAGAVGKEEGEDEEGVEEDWEARESWMWRCLICSSLTRSSSACTRSFSSSSSTRSASPGEALVVAVAALRGPSSSGAVAFGLVGTGQAVSTGEASGDGASASASIIILNKVWVCRQLRVRVTHLINFILPGITVTENYPPVPALPTWLAVLFKPLRALTNQHNTNIESWSTVLEWSVCVLARSERVDNFFAS